MSSNENRKSMDDVLASIRRIVRAEKDHDAAEPVSGGGRPQYRAPGGDEPLALTPDMRMDGGTVEAEAIAMPAEGGRSAATTAPATPAGSTTPASSAAPEAPAAAAPAVAPDREQLRQMVREILLEELRGDAGSEAVRGIVRDELLNGEIGANISENVLRLIQSEIAKALDGG